MSEDRPGGFQHTVMSPRSLLHPSIYILIQFAADLSTRIPDNGGDSSEQPTPRGNFIICPNCKEEVNLGLGGDANLRNHQESSKCKKATAKLKAAKKMKNPLKEGQIKAFFKKVVRAVSPVTSAPLPVHPARQTVRIAPEPVSNFFDEPA
jgi:hypothetical protein